MEAFTSLFASLLSTSSERDNTPNTMRKTGLTRTLNSAKTALKKVNVAVSKDSPIMAIYSDNKMIRDVLFATNAAEGVLTSITNKATRAISSGQVDKGEELFAASAEYLKILTESCTSIQNLNVSCFEKNLGNRYDIENHQKDLAKIKSEEEKEKVPA